LFKSFDFSEYSDKLDQGQFYHFIRNTPWYHDAVYPHFSQAEFERRHTLLREAMTKRGFDCLIVPGGQASWSQGGALTWLSGLVDRRSMAQYLVFPREGEPLLTYAMGGAHTELARKWVSVPNVQPASRGRFAETMVEWIKSLGLERGRIGVLEATANPGLEWPPETQMQTLYAELPNAQIELVSGLFHELAYLKSTEEIEAIARAGDLAVAALQAMVKRAKPGISEHKLTAAATGVILAAEGRPDFIRVGSTPGAAPALTVANPLPSNRKLQTGDMVLLEVSALLQGVTAQVGTVICIGPPEPAIQQFWNEVMVPGFEQLEAQLQPGVGLTDVQQAGKFFRRQGYQSAPLLLHGLDIAASNPRVFIQACQAEPFEEELKPGMVVVLRPNPITADGQWGMCVTRTYAITDQGHQLLTDYPLELVVAQGRS
jgi:Xaa-Pro aminopeptidase